MVLRNLDKRKLVFCQILFKAPNACSQLLFHINCCPFSVKQWRGFCNISKFWNETPIVTTESLKTTNLCNIHRNWPFGHVISFNICNITITSQRHYVTLIKSVTKLRHFINYLSTIFTVLLNTLTKMTEGISLATRMGSHPRRHCNIPKGSKPFGL